MNESNLSNTTRLNYARAILLNGLCLALVTSTSHAGNIPPEKGLLLVDHQPVNNGGPAADTAFRLSVGGDLISNITADDFRLNQSALLGSVAWWGFYGNDFINQEELPPVVQQFRMRIYEARESDGLPGTIHAEHFFDNPFFEPTGRPVLTSVLPPEFRFQASLDEPVTLLADINYWVEVTQIGAEESLYRWIISQTEQDSYAFQNAAQPNWALSTAGADLAFQLYAVPEPGTALLILLSLSFIFLNRHRKKEVDSYD